MHNCIPSAASSGKRTSHNAGHARRKVIRKAFLKKASSGFGRQGSQTGDSECRGIEAGTSWLILGIVCLECREEAGGGEAAGLGKQLAARLWGLKKNVSEHVYRRVQKEH